MSCVGCPPSVLDAGLSSLDLTTTEQRINRQVRIASSRFTMNLAASVVYKEVRDPTTTPKHGGYQRYYDRKKGYWLRPNPVGSLENCSCDA